MKKYLNIIIIVVVIIIAVGVFFYYQSPPPATDSSGSLLVQLSSVSNVVTPEDIALFNQVKAIKIDLRLFDASNTRMFRTLRDFTKTIPDMNMFRDNPFAPVPGVASPFTQSSASLNSRR